MPPGLSQGGIEIAAGAGFGGAEVAGVSGVDGFVDCARRAGAGVRRGGGRRSGVASD
jgi:hypothetical protein